MEPKQIKLQNELPIKRMEEEWLSKFQPISFVENVIQGITDKYKNSLQNVVVTIFEQLGIQPTIENFKRITKIYPIGYMGPEKYYLDYGTDNEIHLFNMCFRFEPYKDGSVRTFYEIWSIFKLDFLQKD